MEFKNNTLVNREKEIARHMMENSSLQAITKKTGLSKKTLSAHINNMMKKLMARNVRELKNLLKTTDLSL